MKEENEKVVHISEGAVAAVQKYMCKKERNNKKYGRKKCVTQ